MKQDKITGLLELLRVARGFTDEQKAVLTANLYKLLPQQVAELEALLKQDALIQIEQSEKEIEARKTLAERRIKALYQYAESRVQAKEESDIADLEAELATI